MRDRIKPNDVVIHKPSGEMWVVAGVNYDDGKLIPKGYPFPSIAKIEDCELMERNYESKPQEEAVIKALYGHGLSSFIDPMSAMFHDML